jgi:hypothetical protein
MKTKLFILSAAVVAAGLFALPATVSMFAGQHSWYDPKDQGIPCEKCHWLEYEEMRGMGSAYTDHVPHVYKDKNENMRYFDCEECHNVTMSISDYYREGISEHTPAHAATTLSCLDCHGGEAYGTEDYPEPPYNVDDIPMHVLARRVHMRGQFAGSDGCDKCHRDSNKTKSFIEHVDDELSHSRAAHRPFFLAMKNDSESQLSDANEACLGCHSRAGVNITWTRNAYVSYHVTCDKSGYSVTWNASDDLGTNETVFGSSSGWN